MNRESPRTPNISRITLGDLTNQLGKRGFSLISRSPASKSAAGAAKTGIKENNSQLTKRISLVGKNSEVEISGAKCPKLPNADNALPLLKGGKTYRLLSRGNSDSAVNSNHKSGKQLSSAEQSLSVLGSDNALLTVVEKSCAYSQSVSKYDLKYGGMIQDRQHKDESQATETELLLETLGSQTASTDGMELGFGAMPSTDCPQFAGSGLTKSQATKPFELERCIWLKGNATTSDAVSVCDPPKSCLCSFCIKAAHIWSELHYMDAKDRISALVKSKKKASNLVGLYSLSSGNFMDRGGGSSSDSSLELDLMKRSKSLFISMEETFSKECSQLEAEFSSLKDMRESFKPNSVGQMHTNLRQCPPDASPCKKIT